MERPSSALSESWATLSTSDIHSEDDVRSEQTDVASLIGQSGPDDVASLEGRDNDSELDSTDLQSNCSESRAFLPVACSGADPTHDSSISTKADFQSSSDSIEFEEPDRWPEVEMVELKHTIRIFDEAETAEIADTLPYDLRNGHLTVTVQQTMARQGLDLDKPFRVLYVGHPQFRQIVLNKIGDVLVAGSDDGFSEGSGDSSRFHVVPTSFGAGATPNYAELLPIHVQLVVDECISATTKKELNGPDTISLSFKNRSPCSSTWTGSNYRVSSTSAWTLPDVAIFFISEKDSLAARRTHQLAHAFMKRHGVPSMVISETPLWGKLEAMMPLDYQSLHICLESRDTITGESRVLGRYPIDLKTFESITPGQLNRNLASLSNISSKSVPTSLTKTQQQSRDISQSADIEKYPNSSSDYPFTDSTYDPAPVLRILMIAIVCLITLSLGYAALKALIVFTLHFFAGYYSTPSIPSNVFGSALTTNVRGLPIRTALQVVENSAKPTAMSDIILSGCAEETSLSINNHLLELSLQAIEQSNQADSFQVHVVGDCHVIIRLPPSLASRKRPPTFDVTVTRMDEKLPYELSRLFEGVYTLRLAREDAYGLMNVSISTRTKPILEQVTEVDFGTPWLKIASWKKAAQAISSQLLRDLNAAHTGLSDAYSRFSTDFQVMSDTVKKAYITGRETEAVRLFSVRRVLETTNAVVAKSKRVSENLKRGAEKQLSMASKLLCEQAQVINGEAMDLANEAWSTMQQRVRKLHQSAHQLHLTHVARKLHRARKSPALAAAQNRARSVKDTLSQCRKSCKPKNKKCSPCRHR
jgi:hypothetical protein